MKNKLAALWEKIHPYFWQELSRVSAICLFAGWIALYYQRFSQVQAGIFTTWIFTVFTLLLAAAFGSYYKHSYQNQKNLFQFLFPGFIIVFILSEQIIRYPTNWPFFSVAFHQDYNIIMHENKLPMDFWHFFYMLILTWRGIRFGREPASNDVHLKAFIWFFVFFTGIQLFVGSDAPVNYIGYFLLMVFLGVAGMPAARIMTSSMLRGGRLPKVQKEWILILFTGAIGFIVLGLLFSLLMNLTVAKVLSSLLISLFTAILLLIFVAMSPLAYLFMLVFEKMMNFFMSNTTQPEINIESGQEAINQAQEQTQEVFRQNLLNLEHYIILGITIALIIIIWYTLKRRGYRHATPLNFEEGVIDEKHPPPRERDLRSLRERLNLPGAMGFSAIRIRWIYANLCHYGKQLGNPRLPAITPFEYQQNLFQLFPENTLEIAEITAAYVAVRYGQVPENPEELKKLQESWEVLENQARQFLKSKKKLEKQTGKKR